MIKVSDDDNVHPISTKQGNSSEVESLKKLEQAPSEKLESLKLSPQKEQLTTIDNSKTKKFKKSHPKEDYTPQESEVLGKRSSLVESNPANEPRELINKVQAFKRGLPSTDPAWVEHNSLILFRLLRHLSSYHGRGLAEVIDQLEDKELDLAKLRIQMCNHTVISRLANQEY